MNENIIESQLHGCCSQVAYCAALYLRKETNTGVYVNLLTAKTKVAPLNNVNDTPFIIIVYVEMLLG